MQHLKEIFEYRDMVWSLVRRELRGKYEKSVLGFLWSFLSPMFQILIYNIVFTQVFRNDTPSYYMYLMTGLLPWTFFSDSLGQGTTVVVGNAEMVKKIYFPREVLVIGEVTAKLINMLLSFLVMAGFLIVSGIGFSKYLLFLPLIILVEYVLALGFSFITASVTVYLRDLEYVVNVILMAWIWGTPVLYIMDQIDSPVLRKVLLANPMTGIINSYHDILFFKREPGVQQLFYSLCEGLVILAVGYLVFDHLNKNFVEEL